MLINYPNKTIQYSFSDLIHCILRNKNISTQNIDTTVILHQKIDSQINQLALASGLCFRACINLAVISGAGIAGLCTSFELLARGYKVIIAEKRGTFSRSNIINFNIEIQRFLKKFHLLKEFEASVAARIKSHRIVHIGKKGTEELLLSDVSKLELSNLSFKPKNYNKLFNDDGIYSIKIKDIQTFLANKALQAGVQIFGNVQVKLISSEQQKDRSKVELIGNTPLQSSRKLKPHLIFIAEGAHSSTAECLDLKTKRVKNNCTDEHWIYGNVNYSGKKTFVVSIVDTSQNTLRIANVIFNAKLKEINIAVTSEGSVSKENIQNELINVVKTAFALEQIQQSPGPLTASVDRTVRVKNEKRKIFSKGNVFLIGDSAGNSSPLAGLGGTLCLTLIPATVVQLLNDSERQPDHRHKNFQTFSEAYISRWMQKSDQVKQFCINMFNKNI